MDEFDDKNFINSLLRKDGRFKLPESRILNCADASCVLGLEYPIVGKPIRGRGSHGVKVCQNESQLCAHLTELLNDDPLVMRVPSKEELNQDPAYAEISLKCEQVAKLLRVTAPIRIDVRRVSKQPGSKFAMFDINMKPNMTGPGRPGRGDQASLTAIAAERLGWDYPALLKQVLGSAQTLEHLRNVTIR